ncbi:MAG: hypothetical protein J6U83_06320 [Bacteroidales bacterium]|nr:hypothetical protein [Bacteroidales bacterium]
MNNYKKLLLWGSLAVAVLAGVIVFLFCNLSSGSGKEGYVVSQGEESVYDGIPSDAVAVLDFKSLEEYHPLLNDTLSFAYKIFNEESGLVRLQRELLQLPELAAAPFVYSLHYSSKNNVSFLQIMDLKGLDNAGVQNVLAKGGKGKRYNNATIYSLPYGVMAAFSGNLLLASSSSHVLESSVRHLESNTSILDNRDFADILKEYGRTSGVYINHNQIGKLFSGIVERGFLGYSDFVMKFTVWSRFDISTDKGKLSLNGTLENIGDESRFSNIFNGQSARKSTMGKILPASTLFAVSLPVSGIGEYMKSHSLFLEVQKKTGAFAYKQKIAQAESKVTPLQWVDSLKIEEIVSAYCKFGEKCEWLTFVRSKQQFGLNNVISAVVDGDKEIVPEPFAYKGYIASVFGELFSHCNEESVCKVGPWIIIGPQKILEEFANGNAFYFNLDQYLGQTPVNHYLGKEANVKMVVNLKEAGDSVLQVFKPYTRVCLQQQMTRNNFEFLTMDIASHNGKPGADVNFYAAVLEKLPAPKEREDGEQMSFEIDSTINLPQGPFQVWDVAKKAEAYLEQLPNMRLRYMDAKKKGVWAIPFDTPIGGYVEQVDLYGNGRLQMLFLSGRKMYLLDRVGRFVYGYPVKLPKEAVMGPVLMKGVNGMDYSVVVLNADNTISWYDISGKPVAGWSDIVAPEFVKELPQLHTFGGRSYWLLKAPSQLLVYTMDGKRLEMLDKKKKIDRESDVEFVQEGVLRVKCTDGKVYNWTLATGKIKKWNN